MGCVMSAAIAVLLCKHKCSVERLTSSMSFHPPQPPSYTLETQSDGTLKLLFTHRDLANVLETLGDRAGVRVGAFGTLAASPTVRASLGRIPVPGCRLFVPDPVPVARRGILR